MNGPTQRADATVWLDGRIVPAAQAGVSVFDHGLLYGDGVFEGVRFYQRRAFRLTAHLQRLERSARALLLSLPYTREQFCEAVADTLAASPLDSGYLRLVVTRGSGPLGLDPHACTAPTAFIIADRLRLLDPGHDGARVIIAATRRAGPDVLDPRIKSLNYLNAILARIEARLAGADEALLLNAAGRVAEGSADNVFVVIDGVVHTPPVTEGALAGITRAVVLACARALNITAAETPLTPYDLYTADEVLLCGTGAELIPVASIDGRVLPSCPGPVTQRLMAAFAATIAAESAP